MPTGGSNVNRWRMRCSQGQLGCGHRFILRQHPLKYKRDVKCPECGSIHVNDVELQRRVEMKNQDTCNCMNLYPHRRGSLLGCVDHPKDMDDWTFEEIQQYLGMMNTPRGVTV